MIDVRNLIDESQNQNTSKKIKVCPLPDIDDGSRDLMVIELIITDVSLYQNALGFYRYWWDRQNN